MEKSFLAWNRAKKAELDADHRDALRDRLSDQGWEEGRPPPKSLKREVKRLRRIERRMQDGSNRTWNEFQDRVRFLRRWGYLTEDGGFGAGAMALRHIQISEVFVTEVFLEGVLDQLEPEDLFGVLCGMCANLPRGASAPAARGFRSLARRIDRIRMSEIVLQSEGSQAEVTWDGAMIPFDRWAEGALSELMSHRRRRGGDLVAPSGAPRPRGSAPGRLVETTPEADVDALIRSVTRMRSRSTRLRRAR